MISSSDLPSFFSAATAVVNNYQHIAIFSQLGFPGDFAVSRNNNGFVSYSAQVCLGRFDHAFDVSAGGIIDKGVMAVPPGVAAVKNICFGEVGRDVAISMARAVIFERDRGAIDVQCFFIGKNFTWNRACGGRAEK